MSFKQKWLFNVILTSLGLSLGVNLGQLNKLNIADRDIKLLQETVEMQRLVIIAKTETDNPEGIWAKLNETNQFNGYSMSFKNSNDVRYSLSIIRLQKD